MLQERYRQLIIRLQALSITEIIQHSLRFPLQQLAQVWIIHLQEKGDTRYLPLNWTEFNTNTWSSAPYTASFGMAQSGDHTLKVTFQLQKFDGTAWKSIEDYASCKVPFHVSKASVTGPGQNLTPAADRRNAVRTGDSTPVLPFVIHSVVAAVAIGGVIIYKKKK